MGDAEEGKIGGRGSSLVTAYDISLGYCQDYLDRVASVSVARACRNLPALHLHFSSTRWSLSEILFEYERSDSTVN